MDGYSYRDGMVDGRRHAREGKPALSSPSAYGRGFYDGWKSIRYPELHPTEHQVTDRAESVTRMA
jgi:hypothetical protein